MERNYQAAQGTQRRTIVAELRAVGGDGASDEFALVGYASRFNVLSRNLGGFRETVMPGTFARSIREGADVKCLLNHAADNILGRTKSRTLELAEDSLGLHFRCQLDRNQRRHLDIHAAVKRGDIDECSFAFMVPKGGQSWSDGRDPETGDACAFRTLTDVDLIDVSAVTYPAYPNTSVGARAQRSLADYGSAGLNDHVTALVRAAILQEQQGLIEAREMMRRVAQMMVRNNVPRRSESSPLDYAEAMNGHLQMAHEAAELAYACARTAGDMLDYMDGEDPDEDTDSRRRKIAARNANSDRKLHRANHRAMHAALDLACNACADARLSWGKVMGAGKQGAAK